MHSLTLVVYVRVVVWACVLYVYDSFKFKVGLWWSWFHDSTFKLGTVWVRVCSEVLGTSSSLAVEEVVYVGPV